MNKTLMNLAIVASFGLNLPAFAHETDTPTNEAVVGDAAGHCVTDGSGVNVRTSSWTDEKGAEACAPNKPAPAAAAEPAPAMKSVSESVTLSAAALFEFDSAMFKREAQPQLDEFAARVRAMSSITAVNIVGHTDSVGTDAYNQGLSERRAMSVKNFLIEKGVDASLISASGMGESQPVADNSTKDGRAQNRRVEVTFKGLEQVK